jgi:ParB family chromosome partitioning protein
MSTENRELQTQLLMLDPTQIIEPEITNVRPFSAKLGDTEEEIKAIEALAATIEEEGQLQPVKVRRLGEDGVFEIIAGRRRKKAIELINAGRKAGEELKVVAVLSDSDVNDPSAFRQAAIENWHRKGLSAMDMAHDIRTVRENFKWAGSKGTKKVAEFFKVSPALITTYEELLKLPDDMQAKVHRNEVSRDDAFKLAKIAKEKGADVAASTLAEAEKAASDVAEQAAAEGKKGVKKAASAAKRKKIAQAARESSDTPSPRSKKEILEYFEGMMGPAYGYANGAVWMFVENLLKYAAGEIQERTLDKYWDAMVEKAARGTAPPKEKVETKKTAKPKK